MSKGFLSKAGEEVKELLQDRIRQVVKVSSTEFIEELISGVAERSFFSLSRSYRQKLHDQDSLRQLCTAPFHIFINL